MGLERNSKQNLWGTILLFFAVLASSVPDAKGAILTFDSPDFASNAATRTSWVTAIGENPDFIIDFDSLSDGQAITALSGVTFGSFAAECTTGGVGGSNPVGLCSAMGLETTSQTITFDTPVDYVGFLGIDYTSLSITIHFVGGGSVVFATPDGTAASGNSAEFTGIFRNDQPRITGLTFSASGLGGWGLDNLEYGTLDDSSDIPEPSSLGLVGLTLLSFSIALWSRRRVGQNC